MARHAGCKYTSANMMRYVAERLARSELREFEDDTHFTLHRHLGRVLTELVPEHSCIKY
jgi:hypothetical protein